MVDIIKPTKTNQIMQIKFLGQAGILILGKKATIIIDPYLSNFVVTGGYGSTELFSRNFPPPILPENLPLIDAVFITHDHADHCDLDTLSVIAANNPKCIFIGPKPVRDYLSVLENFQNQIVIPSPKISILAGNPGIEYCCLPSAHYKIEQNSQSGEYKYLGYLIRMDNIVLYHSGDTILYDEIVENILKPGREVDIACLPVNGRDEKREQLGIVGNLNAPEAVDLALAIKARMIIPMHNDLFTINQEDPELVKETFSKVKGIEIKQMAPGETFLYKLIRLPFGSLNSAILLCFSHWLRIYDRNRNFRRDYNRNLHLHRSSIHGRHECDHAPVLQQSLRGFQRF